MIPRYIYTIAGRACGHTLDAPKSRSWRSGWACCTCSRAAAAPLGRGILRRFAIQDTWHVQQLFGQFAADARSTLSMAVGHPSPSRCRWPSAACRAHDWQMPRAWLWGPKGRWVAAAGFGHRFDFLSHAQPTAARTSLRRAQIDFVRTAKINAEICLAHRLRGDPALNSSDVDHVVEKHAVDEYPEKGCVGMDVLPPAADLAGY